MKKFPRSILAAAAAATVAATLSLQPCPASAALTFYVDPNSP